MPATARPRTNLAARAGRWSASHRRTAILGWIAFVVAAVVLGQAVGFRTPGGGGDGEARRAPGVLDRHFPPPPPQETVLVSSATHRVHDAAFRDTVAHTVRRLKAADHVKKVDVGAASADRHSRIIHFDLDADDDTASDRVAASLAATAATESAHPGFRV